VSDEAPRPSRYDLVGERVALGPLRPELFALHHAWVNDPEVGWNVFGAPQSRTFEEERDWLVREPAKPDNRFWLVYRTDEHRPIGVASLTEIDRDAGSAMFRILIGAAGDRGHGFGTEATRQVLDYGFRELGLREVRPTSTASTPARSGCTSGSASGRSGDSRCSGSATASAGT
jgi:RimJ/RimL family protein N-acetyltransferase